MRFQAVPDDQERLLQMGLERLEELDDLFFLDAALVQPEQTVGPGEPCDDRDVIPVEVKLDHRGLSLQGPGAHTRRPLADARLADEDNQSAFPLGFFLSAGQVRRFHWRTASSSRSIARFSGFLHAESQCAQNAPDLGLAEFHAIHALDEDAHALEGPQLGAKAVLAGLLQHRRA